MRKYKGFFLSSLILCLLVLLAPSGFGDEGSEYVFFEDDFEPYYVGIFPAQNWDLRFYGAGSDFQVIMDDPSVSSSKYLQLVSIQNWAARASVPIPSETRFVGFEVNVMLPETDGSHVPCTRAGFSEYGTQYAANWHAYVCIYSNGEIEAADASPLDVYDVSNWTNIKLLLDRDLNIYSVWINGELKIEDKVFSADPYLYNYFSLESTYHANNKVYFDDVKIFLIYDAKPVLELQPVEGMFQTTVHGSGYAPNSEITITWNGTKMFTVPNLVQTDGYGNFSAIISVLNQSQMGSYQVTAIDALENQATATFNVIPEFPSWLLCLLLLAGTLLVTAFKKISNLQNRF